MLKKITFILSLFLLTSSCSMISQNIKARKNLAKCDYEVKEIVLEEIKFSNQIVLNNQDIIDIKKTPHLAIIKVLPQIKNTNFKLKINHMRFDIKLEVINKTLSDVALDRVEADIFIDNSKITNIKHRKFIKIKPKKSIITAIEMKAPFDEMSFDGKPKTITIVGKIYLTILYGKSTLKTPLILSIKKTVPIPYDLISNQIKKKKEQIKQLLIAKTKNKIKSKIPKRIKKLW